jgi:DNA processing protein
MSLYATTELLRPLNDWERKNAPRELWVEGDKSLLRDGLRVSVVGSRKPSREGMVRAKAFASALAERGIVVVSGLAMGIDTIAHEAAISSGGRTIAVLGTPLDEAYPKSNERLLGEIKQNHLAISQFPEGYPFRPANFPRRNRTMALISDATVIIEASEKSGTKHQGWEAIRLGRLVFLLESVATNPELTWPKEMIEYGAQVINRDTLDQALDNLPSLTSGEEFAF